MDWFGICTVIAMVYRIMVAGVQELRGYLYLNSSGPNIGTRDENWALKRGGRTPELVVP